MQVSHFAKQMLVALPDILSKPEKLNRPNSLVALESSLSVDMMRSTLEAMLDMHKEADEVTLAPLLKLFRDRLDIIKNTDSIFPYNPHTHANQWYWHIAQAVSNFVNEHPIKIMISSLTINSYEIDPNERLDQIVLSDNNKSIIKVLKALENERYRKNLAHTYSEDKPLSAAEKKRITDFNYQTARYHQDIIHNQSEKRLDKDENNLRKKIGYVAVRGTYGVEGNKRLAQKLNYFNKTLSKTSLISILSHLPYSSWKGFLSRISEQNLEKILVEGQNFDCQRDYQPYLNGDEKNDRALLFACLDLYRRQLNSKPGFTLYKVAKAGKTTASSIVYDLLQENVPLDKIKETAILKIQKKLMLPSGEQAMLIRSLDMGLLKMLLPNKLDSTNTLSMTKC